MESELDQRKSNLIIQHKQRLSYMPWLYFSLKEKHKSWAVPWQKEYQSRLCDLETVKIVGDCFIAPDAKLFAEPGRPIVIEDGSFIGADAFLHGPITIGKNVGINHHCSLDGGRAGIHIGDHSRIAAYCQIFAFNHGYDKDRLISDQKVSSKGIRLGKDVWLGAHTGIVDGVEVGDGAIIGMNSTVTHSIPAGSKAAGAPARIIGHRQ